MEETIKLIENNEISFLELNNTSINTNLGAKDKIEENKKIEKIKNLRREIYILEDKIKFYDLEVRSMQNLDDEKKRNFDMKSFQQNFEKDIEDVKEKEVIWRRDQFLRIKKFEDEQERVKEKLLEKLEHEEMEKNQKKQEKYMEQLEKLKQKNEALIENKEIYRERNKESIPMKSSKLVYRVAEENFKQKELIEKEEYKIKMTEELAKVKNLKRRINLEEIEEYKKSYDEKQKKIKYEAEKERLLKKEELIKKNLLLPKSDTKLYEKISEEEKKIRIIKEKEKMDRVYAAMKIKQFSKIVQKTIVPKIDEVKKNELQEKISKSQQIRPERIGKSKTERIILKKPDPDKQRKYKWELKLDPIDKVDNNKKNKKKEYKLDYNNTYCNDENEILESASRIERGKSMSQKKRPREKNPDYLTNIRKEREKTEDNDEQEESKKLKFLIN